jgi:predicted CopG family antitoxin
MAGVRVLHGNPEQGLCSVVDDASDVVLAIERSPLQCDGSGWRPMTTAPELSCIRPSIQTGMSKSIRVDEDTHRALAALKAEDETFDELLTRLLRERRETVRAGAGLWEGTDAAERAREARAEMKRGVGDP